MDLENHFRILVVDDVPANILVVKLLLEAEGYAAFGATSAAAAREYLETDPVDLILLDVMMPEVSGFEFARELAAEPELCFVPVIFLSALQESNEIATGLESGGVDYISKPFRKPELLARVRTHLQLSQSRKQLREQNLLLERLAREAREASQARDKFVAILAHDLRNPFSGILSLVTEMEFNLDQFSPEELRDAVQSVYNSTRQVSDLLHSLLEWAQTQTGAQVIHKNMHSVEDLVNQALKPLTGMIGKKELKVTQSINNCQVWADENTLLVIFRNLLSNAIKFTPRGGSIRVEGFNEGEHTVVSIRDSGVGISAQTISELFRLDIRTTTAGTESESGSGLGLLLCKEFIERNDGSLEVESQLGQGSLFRVRLPSNKDIKV